MNKTLFLGIVMIAAGTPASADQGQKPECNLPGKAVTGENYSTGALMLRGEVLAVSEEQVSLWDWNADDMVKVELAKNVRMSHIEPGDKVRVEFAQNGEEAAKVTEETY